MGKRGVHVGKPVPVEPHSDSYYTDSCSPSPPPQKRPAEGTGAPDRGRSSSPRKPPKAVKGNGAPDRGRSSSAPRKPPKAVKGNGAPDRGRSSSAPKKRPAEDRYSPPPRKRPAESDDSSPPRRRRAKSASSQRRRPAERRSQSPPPKRRRATEGGSGRSPSPPRGNAARSGGGENKAGIEQPAAEKLAGFAASVTASLSEVRGLAKSTGTDGPRPAAPTVTGGTVAMAPPASGTAGPDAVIAVGRDIADHLMTPANKLILLQESGCNVEWNTKEAKVLLSGASEHIKACQRLLARVIVHCKWGIKEGKLKQLLKPQAADSVLCKLSPMNLALPAIEKVLAGTIHSQGTRLTIGNSKGQGNDVTINDKMISRTHVQIELDPDRGSIYAIDFSTNGTFLNGLQLPSKKGGKVLLSHGDELLLKSPDSGGEEFGYIVNIEIIHSKNALKLTAPRRIEETSKIL